MTTLVAGIDVSGNPQTGNYKFMGIVIGTEEKIRATVKKTGFSRPHMNRIKSGATQKRIVSEIGFDAKESTAFCVLIDRKAVIRQTKQRGMTQRYARKKAYRVYNRAVAYHMQKRIGEFLTGHGSTVHDVVWQCDGDCRNIVKENGLQYGKTGPAYHLADVVAWANNRGTEPRGTTAADLTGRIGEELAKALK